jgi:hypothetical protein
MRNSNRKSVLKRIGDSPSAKALVLVGTVLGIVVSVLNIATLVPPLIHQKQSNEAANATRPAATGGVPTRTAVDDSTAATTASTLNRQGHTSAAASSHTTSITQISTGAMSPNVSNVGGKVAIRYGSQLVPGTEDSTGKK